MELLDKKGLTTVWAAIKSNAVGGLTVDYEPELVNMTLTAIDGGEVTYPYIQGATGDSAGVMTAADKTKLDGIATGANKYTLPVASATTLGGIKTGFASKIGIGWEVDVDEQGNAYANIGGLHSDSKGKIGYIDIEGNNIYAPATRYRNNGISSGLPGNQANFTFPSKSGTLALTSDCGSLIMNGDIVNNNIGFNGYKQNVLISASGNYNISNWYNSSPVGSVMDIYPYDDINGVITAGDKYIFQTMGTSSSGLPIIVTKKSINLSNSHYIRLIHTSDGVYVCVSVLGY